MPESYFQRRIRKIVENLLGCTVRTEVNVRKLFPEHPAHGEFYDLVVDLYKIVIECHGEHHWKPVAYSGDVENASLRLASQKHRDLRKKEIALENNWGYVCFWRNTFPTDEDEAKELVSNEIIQSIRNREEP